MIAELDRVLRQSRSWNPWKLWHRFVLQRYTLERVRNFLILQQRPNSAPHPIAPITSRTPIPADPALKSDHQRLVQEIQTLTAQRNALKAEIKYLEQTQLLQTNSASTQNHEPAHPLAAASPTHESRQEISQAEQQLAQLESLRERTDFLLSSMDSSLQLSFNALLKNVEVYSTTLHQGIDRMHSLGYQGEVLFSALVNHLAQGVGRELSSNSSPTNSPPLDRFLTDLPPPPSAPAPSSIISAAPSAASVSAVPPAPSDPDPSLTLEQIFADLPSEPTPSETPITNRSISQGSSPPVEPAWGQCTLEEMNHLFADAPALPAQLTA